MSSTAAAPGDPPAWEQEARQRFGLLPGLYRSLIVSPRQPPPLWQHARMAYLDNPLPALLKERLFLHLSRFCESRYCAARHAAFLLGQGHPAGDTTTLPQSPEDVRALLARAPCSAEDLQQAAACLSAQSGLLDQWPLPGEPEELALLDLAAAVFTDPARAQGARLALLQALGTQRLQWLLTFLAFVRHAHFWSLLHPELPLEDDVIALLRQQPELDTLLRGRGGERGAQPQRLHAESLELQSLRQRRAELELAHRALQERDRQKDEFLAMLSHELRNPLAPLRSTLELLRLSEPGSLDPAPLHEMLERQVDHLVHLVDDLLDVQRISHGKVTVRKEAVDLLLVVNTAVEASMPHIVEAHQRLHLSLLAAPLRVLGDRVRLTQVLTNLLNNAARHTDAGGDVWLTVQREGGSATISVRDSGCGIPAAMLPHVFDLYAQAASPGSESSAGLGVGLALVQHLVQLHGGSVQARSEGPGRGSEFLVRLPLALQGLPRVSSSEARVFCVTARVLLVDDNRAAADPVGALLRLIGAEVRVCYDGASALRTIEDGFSPDAVVIDLGMPVMDGFELARRLRELACGRDALLIALTGWGHEQHKQMTQAAGFDHHLTKPIDIAALQATLSTIRRPAVPG
ncbi:ATP-binding protein [Aquabacterium sp. A7-Y]|uniref:hybrid sensor histidine kinase/response regulator n=1 Tax=Aquabacterium sp. A7-Y TaxID=1349605 RepID=UPI00223D4648|nr:ATP-binding protein [Aquabacterium sp. A7-Y]MCW7540351.1 ATP-binding protein [Aquabacterium sp. A7-Y]